MTTEKKEMPICRKCGSTHLAIDAVAAWDTETQDWVLSGTHDCITCQVCEHEQDWADWIPVEPIAECQNCEWIGPVSKLKEIQHYDERVEPGEPEPEGECPHCWGALCHLKKAA